MDKTREKQRKFKLIEKEEKKDLNDRSIKHRDKSWSKEKERKVKKLRRKEKKENLKRKRGSAGHKFDDDDVDELNREVGLMKKLKKGKITKEEFDIAVNDVVDDDLT